MFFNAMNVTIWFTCEFPINTQPFVQHENKHTHTIHKTTRTTISNMNLKKLFRNRHRAIVCIEWKRKNAQRKHGDTKYYLHFIPLTKRYLTIFTENVLNTLLCFAFASISIAFNYLRIYSLRKIGFSEYICHFGFIFKLGHILHVFYIYVLNQCLCHPDAIAMRFKQQTDCFVVTYIHTSKAAQWFTANCNIVWYILFSSLKIYFRCKILNHFLLHTILWKYRPWPIRLPDSHFHITIFVYFSLNLLLLSCIISTSTATLLRQLTTLPSSSCYCSSFEIAPKHFRFAIWYLILYFFSIYSSIKFCIWFFVVPLFMFIRPSFVRKS